MSRVDHLLTRFGMAPVGDEEVAAELARRHHAPETAAEDARRPDEEWATVLIRAEDACETTILAGHRAAGRRLAVYAKAAERAWHHALTHRLGLDVARSGPAPPPEPPHPWGATDAA